MQMLLIINENLWTVCKLTSLRPEPSRFIHTKSKKPKRSFEKFYLNFRTTARCAMRSCIGLMPPHKQNSNKIFLQIKTMMFRIMNLQMLTTSLIQQMRSRNKKCEVKCLHNKQRKIHTESYCHLKRLLVNTVVDSIPMYYVFYMITNLQSMFQI